MPKSALITATLLALSMAATACRSDSVPTARPGAQTPPPSTSHSTSPSAPTIRATAFPVTKTAPPNSTGWMKVKARGNLADTIRTAVAYAHAAKLKAIAYLGPDWCELCRAIKKHRQHPLMLAALKGVQIIEIDVSVQKSRALDALGLKSSAIPIFYDLG